MSPSPGSLLVWFWLCAFPVGKTKKGKLFYWLWALEQLCTNQSYYTLMSPATQAGLRLLKYWGWPWIADPRTSASLMLVWLYAWFAAVQRIKQSWGLSNTEQALCRWNYSFSTPQTPSLMESQVVYIHTSVGANGEGGERDESLLIDNLNIQFSGS